MTDEELYRRYLDGDEKSVDELMRRHESGLIHNRLSARCPRGRGLDD